jgi:uncharacterized cupin superfamily protein
MPGCVSSRRHWHSAEDEFLYVLEGVATVVDNDGPQDLLAGDAVCWRHGEPNAHHVKNLTNAPLVYLIVGSRVAGDICHYPDDGQRQVNGVSHWQMLDALGVELRGGPLPAHLFNLPQRWGVAFDGEPLPKVIRKGSVQGVDGCGYPAIFDNLGPYLAWPLSDAGGLTQFGAFTETLMPGSQSSQRHWHEAEDEFLYVLDGEVTVVEEDGEHLLTPGQVACWPKGVANGHCLRNRSARPVLYLVVGTRLAEDRCHYPDIDLSYTRRNGVRTMSRKDGTPYPGWPKGVPE